MCRSNIIDITAYTAGKLVMLVLAVVCLGRVYSIARPWGQFSATRVRRKIQPQFASIITWSGRNKQSVRKNEFESW